MTCSQLRITLRFSARLLKISLRIPWVPEVQAFLQKLPHPKKKMDTVFEARFLAESMRVVPPLAKIVLKKAIGQLRPPPNRKRTKGK
jgi:hypothetical protein